MEITKKTITTIKLKEDDMHDLAGILNGSISLMIDYEDGVKLTEDSLSLLRFCYHELISLCDDLGILDNPKVVMGNKIVLGGEL